PGSGISSHASQNEIAAPTRHAPATRETGPPMAREASTRDFVAKCSGSLRNGWYDPASRGGEPRMLRRLARWLHGASSPMPGLLNMLEATPNLVGISVDDRVVYANAATRRLLGFDSQRELLGVFVYDFIHPDDQERAREAVTRMRGTGLSVPF